MSKNSFAATMSIICKIIDKVFDGPIFMSKKAVALVRVTCRFCEQKNGHEDHLYEMIVASRGNDI